MMRVMGHVTYDTIRRVKTSEIFACAKLLDNRLNIIVQNNPVQMLSNKIFNA